MKRDEFIKLSLGAFTSVVLTAGYADAIPKYDLSSRDDRDELAEYIRELVIRNFNGKEMPPMYDFTQPGLGLAPLKKQGEDIYYDPAQIKPNIPEGYYHFLVSEDLESKDVHKFIYALRESIKELRRNRIKVETPRVFWRCEPSVDENFSCGSDDITYSITMRMSIQLI